MFLFVTIISTLLAGVWSTRIIEERHQNIIQYNQYCPKFQTCHEGTHVMCMYYIPNRKWGPRCHGSLNVSITSERAERILRIVNGLRARVAQGIEAEYDGSLIPRGYGMYRLEWDPELATFAQLWSDQCSLDKDRCRATKTFPDPGQVAGMNRFSIKEWMPIHSKFKNYFNESGFNENKVDYAIDRIIRSIYVVAKNVLKSEDLKSAPRVRTAIFPYLQLIYGPATHIGCGITTFSENYKIEYASNLLYNVIRMICNLSSRIDTGMPAYTMTPSKEPGWTVRCGCPPDYDEDKNCLCYPSEPNKVCVGNQCKSTLVVLPIFTVEDVPRNKLEMQERDVTNNKYPASYKRSFPRISMYNKKPSLFTYSQQHKNYSMTKLGNLRNKMVPRDVISRKSFANLPVLVSNYLKQKHLKMLNKRNKNSNIDLTNEQNFKRSRKKVKNQNTASYFNATKNEYTFQNIKQVQKQKDEQLMRMLERLEKEVHNVKLSKKEREIVDNKVKSIYAALAADSDLLRKSYSFIKNEFDDKDQFCYHGSVLTNYRKLVNDMYGNKLHKNLQKQKQNLFNRNDNFKKDVKGKIPNTHRISNKISASLKGKRLRNIFDIRDNHFNDKEPNTRSTINDVANKNWNLKMGETNNLLHYKDKNSLRTLENIEREIRTNQKPNRYSDVIEEQLKPRTEEQLFQKRVNDIYMPNRAQVIYGF